LTQLGHCRPSDRRVPWSSNQVNGGLRPLSLPAAYQQ